MTETQDEEATTRTRAAAGGGAARGRTSRGRLVTAAAGGAGLAVVLAAGIALKRPLSERWYTSRLDASTFEVREAAAARLGELGSAQVIPRLTRAVGLGLDRLTGEQGPGAFAAMEALYAETQRQVVLRRRLQARSRAAERDSGAPSDVRSRPRRSGLAINRTKVLGQLSLLKSRSAALDRRIEQATARLLDQNSYRALVRVTARAGKAALPYLLRELESADWRLRWVTLRAVGDVAPSADAPEVIAALENAAEDENLHVRYAATRALSRTSEPPPDR